VYIGEIVADYSFLPGVTSRASLRMAMQADYPAVSKEETILLEGSTVS